MDEKIEAWLNLEESAGYYLNAKNYAKADELYNRLVRSLSKEFSANDLNLLWAKRHWSEVLTQCGKFEDADRVQYDLLETLGRPDPGEERDIFKEVIDLRIERAKELHASGHYEEALAILSHARDYSTEVLGRKDAWTDQIRLNTETVREDQIKARLKQQRRALRAEQEKGKSVGRGELEVKETTPRKEHVYDGIRSFSLGKPSQRPKVVLVPPVNVVAKDKGDQKLDEQQSSFESDTSPELTPAEFLNTDVPRRPRQKSVSGELPPVPASPDPARGRLLNQAQPSLAVPERGNRKEFFEPLRSKSEEPPLQKEALRHVLEPAETDLISFTDVQLFRDAQLLSVHNIDCKMADEWFSKYLKKSHAFLSGFRLKSGVGKRPRIAVLDTGLDTAHPDVQRLMKKPKDKDAEDPRRFKGFWSWDEEEWPAIEDSDGHGTHCAMILNQTAPDADIFVARVFQDRDHVTGEHVLEALKHAVEKWNVDIVSMSFALSNQDKNKDAIGEALWRYQDRYRAKDEKREPVLFFAAASNAGMNSDRTFPAKYPAVFSVHACNGQGAWWDGNPKKVLQDCNFTAIGQHLRPLPSEPGIRVTGTSMATPVAAGIAAIVLEFVRQDLVDHQEEVSITSKLKLKTRAGMEAAFMELERGARTFQDDHYVYLAPWQLFSKDVGMGDGQLARRRIASRLNEALEKIS